MLCGILLYYYYRVPLTVELSCKKEEAYHRIMSVQNSKGQNVGNTITSIVFKLKFLLYKKIMF